ncbi:MAG: amidinotransferase [Blastocatellia bacterium]|nr:amidinotransferase [Blastocatellia bacterium]
MQTTANILMVRPAAFGYNAETAASNAFQNTSREPEHDVAKRAVAEFETVVECLEAKGVSVLVIDDSVVPLRPDAAFPNNWLSLHETGDVILYPMATPNRRSERRLDVIERLRDEFFVRDVIDLTKFEHEGKYLEGTGSIVFDHITRIAFACPSFRTDTTLLDLVCERLGYAPFKFHAVDRGGLEIYHTNVMMCIATEFAVICAECISSGSPAERLAESGREIVEITVDQMHDFAGNMLVVRDNLLLMSQRTRNALRNEQIRVLEKYCEILSPNIPTIETVGGGSVRCMIAENFLPKL